VTAVISTVGDLLLALLALATLPAFARLLRGPSLADRVVAVDLITAIGVAVSALYATLHDAPVFLDVAILVALITFVGTIAFALYIERRSERTDEQ
jgi:multicomponent Na+:H+ antiporter subunit F